MPASTVCVQVGQCGNQVGEAYFDQLSRADDGETFFRERARGGRTARAVLVDTEPRVSSQCVLGARGGWHYDRHGHVIGGDGLGAANNWACGFMGDGARDLGAVLDCVQRELEACDSVDSIVVLGSAAGGTGSGLGSLLASGLRELCPHTSLLNALVLPYRTGEIITQHYNSLLSLAHLADAADAVLLVENEQVHRACTHMLHNPRPSFADLNRVIAADVAAVTLPLAPASGGRDALLSASLAHVCPHPGFPLLTARLTPQMPRSSIRFTSDTWGAILKRMRQMHVSDAALECDTNWAVRADAPGANRSVASLLALHGETSASADTSAWRDRELYADWSVDPLRVAVRSRPFAEMPCAAATLSNSQSALAPVDNLCARAYDMFTSRAYVHQYTQHGLELDAFLDAFVQVEQIIQSYRGLT